MVSITLAVPEDIKEKMDSFDEMNWSGFIRKCIAKKADELTLKEQLLGQLAAERELTDWAVALQRSGRKK